MLLSLNLFTERCLHFLEFSKSWHSPEDASFPAHFSHITQTTKSPEILSSFPLLLLHRFFPSHAKISLLKFMASSDFTFSVLCGRDIVHVPDFPVFGTRLSTSCPIVILDDFNVPEENSSYTLATTAYGFCLYWILTICFQGYTSGCFITQNSMILNSHILLRTPIFAPLFLLLAQDH